MGHSYYSEIKLHVTWHTKGSLPLLTPQVQNVVYRCLRLRLVNTPNVYVHEIGGIQTHVHLALSIPPAILISELIGQLKGSSSYEVNQQLD